MIYGQVVVIPIIIKISWSALQINKEMSSSWWSDNMNMTQFIPTYFSSINCIHKKIHKNKKNKINFLLPYVTE